MNGWIIQFLRARGFVPVAGLTAANESIAELRNRLAAEQHRHAEAVRMRDDAEAFIKTKLELLTLLEPVKQWPILEHPQPLAAEGDFDAASQLVVDIVEGRRRDIVIRVAVPAVFDYWGTTGDIRAIDQAFEWIAQSAAHKIAGTLRFGLTGLRKAAYRNAVAGVDSNAR